MNYVYDIILNFSDSFFYDFYEWDVNDNIINLKKVPIIKVNKNTIYDFINYKIKIDKNFLSTINNKTIFLKKDKNKYNYICILSDGKKSIGICFYKNGFVLYKSAMLLDEEDEVNKMVVNQKEININYKKYEYNSNKILRCDIKRKKEIIKELNREYKNKEYDKLKYIYYEIYNKQSNDIESIYNTLINNINDYLNKINNVVLK